MTIDEAIKTIDSIKFVCRGLFPQGEQDALSLGIEALKREVNYRLAHPDAAPYLLPGETEE